MKILRRFWKKQIRTKKNFSTLEVYDETPILVTVGITEYVVESVARKLSVILVPGVTDSEAL